MGLYSNFMDFLNNTIFLPDPFDPYDTVRLLRSGMAYEANGICWLREPHHVTASLWAIACHGRNSVVSDIDYAADRCTVLCFALEEKYNNHLRVVLASRKGTKLLRGVKRTQGI